MTIEDQKLYFEKSMPKGKGFYDWIFSLDSKKEKYSQDIFVTDFEYGAANTFEVIPDFLEVLYKVATCGYGCRGGSHVIEYISGRGYNLGIASLKLIRIGFYDESISLIRSISEIVNLFALFGIEHESLKEWYEQTEKDRIRNFSPSKVRERLSKTDLEPPISREYYSKMCEVGVHVNPTTKPQGKNHIDRALVGGFVVKEQAISALNDLVNNLSWLALMSLRNSVDKKTFIEETDRLKPFYNGLEKISLSLENIDEHFKTKQNGS